VKEQETDVIVKEIVASLYAATSGQQVFEAMNRIPTENLIDISKMIDAIIDSRADNAWHIKKGE
jgi:hypothetical protein